MLFNRIGLTNGQMDEFLSLVTARALELEDVLTKANGIVRDFLVQFHHERHPDMTRPPQLHAESHEVQRRTSSEKEPIPALNHGVGSVTPCTLTVGAGSSHSLTNSAVDSVTRVALPAHADKNARLESDLELRQCSLRDRRQFDGMLTFQVHSNYGEPTLANPSRHFEDELERTM